MSSNKAEKKSASSKRVPVPRSVGYTKEFQKDWDTLSSTGRFDMKRLKDVMMELISNDGSLPPERNDHPRRGAVWRDYRECHIGGDFLLIYKFGQDNGIVFARAGTHAELFHE